jgi:hypothetical protein
MVYDIQNYWGTGLCPSSEIKEIRSRRFGNFFCFYPQVKRGGRLLCPIVRANLNHRNQFFETSCSSFLNPGRWTNSRIPIILRKYSSDIVMSPKGGPTPRLTGRRAVASVVLGQMIIEVLDDWRTQTVTSGDSAAMAPEGRRLSVA